MNRLLRIVALCLAPVAAVGQDVVAVSPKSCKVEVENTWVRAVRIKLAPHEKLPFHSHPSSVMVFLTDTNERLVARNRAHLVTHKAGETAWARAGGHIEENLSETPVEFVIVEFKADAPKPVFAPVKLDPVKLDPKYHTVDFENDRVRVLRTVLEPHIKSPMHEHPPYVVVYLTELHTTMALSDGRLVDNPRHPGEVAWRDRMQHSTENIGDRTAMEIQIELKQGAAPE